LIEFGLLFCGEGVQTVAKLCGIEATIADRKQILIENLKEAQ